MDKALDRAAALAAAEPFIDCGCAVHWLRPRDKMPVAREWSTAPVHTHETLTAEYRDGANLGIRLGEPSKTPGGYLHIIDLDIRKPELAARGVEGPARHVARGPRRSRAWCRDRAARAATST